MCGGADGEKLCILLIQFDIDYFAKCVKAFGRKRLMLLMDDLVCGARMLELGLSLSYSIVGTIEWR